MIRLVYLYGHWRWNNNYYFALMSISDIPYLKPHWLTLGVDLFSRLLWRPHFFQHIDIKDAWKTMTSKFIQNIKPIESPWLPRLPRAMDQVQFTTKKPGGSWHWTATRLGRSQSLSRETAQSEGPIGCLEYPGYQAEIPWPTIRYL